MPSTESETSRPRIPTHAVHGLPMASTHSERCRPYRIRAPQKRKGIRCGWLEERLRRWIGLAPLIDMLLGDVRPGSPLNRCGGASARRCSSGCAGSFGRRAAGRDGRARLRRTRATVAPTASFPRSHERLMSTLRPPLPMAASWWYGARGRPGPVTAQRTSEGCRCPLQAPHVVI